MSYIPTLSRTRVQAWIEEGRVTVNGAATRRPADRLTIGDVVELAFPETPPLPTPPAQEMPLDVLYEDAHLLALNKPPGLLVHPTPKERADTLW
ncbi:MAG TPA: S4 domain-containing protein, partial [Thermoanaerobaculia bacterium]|nr:S4 domain-containing protein [Thermoanaerobaculia bacterium]